jgi:hypothetical protein
MSALGQKQTSDWFFRAATSHSLTLSLRVSLILVERLVRNMTECRALGRTSPSCRSYFASPDGRRLPIVCAIHLMYCHACLDRAPDHVFRSIAARKRHDQIGFAFVEHPLIAQWRR